MSSKTTNKKSEIETNDGYTFKFGKHLGKSLKDVLSITTEKKNKQGEMYIELTGKNYLKFLLNLTYVKTEDKEIFKKALGIE